MKPKFESLKRSARFTSPYIDWLRKKIQITNIRNQVGHYGWFNRNKNWTFVCQQTGQPKWNEHLSKLKAEPWMNRKYE